MRRHRPSILALTGVIVVGLTGCNAPEEPAAPPPAEPTAPVGEPAPVAATFVCDSGLTVAVAWPDAQSAQVTYRDRTYVLRSAQTGSGARYRDAEVEWRSVTRDGVEQATLSRIVDREATVVLERCQRPAPPPTVPVKAPDIVPPVGAAPASEPCKAPQLTLSAEGGDAGMGNRVSIVGVRNIGTRACSLTGYPGVVLQDKDGRDLTTVRSEPTPGSYFRAGQTPTPVQLKPQAKAFFDIAWTAVPHEDIGETVCPSATRIRVTAPDDTAAVSLDQTFTPCGRRIRVSPLRPVAEPAPAPQG